MRTTSAAATLITLLSGPLLGQSQSIPATVQNNTWNSTFSLSPTQIRNANLSSDQASGVNVALQFERTNWAGNSAADDPFYNVPANSSHLPPGSIISVEEFTNASLYTLPPSTALSRILFQSETLDGHPVPASAFVLWPYLPKEDPQCPGKHAVVGWAHGASGTFGECAPSHVRNLWYQFAAPFTLALQGYVVVAPDYAGLGVTHYANGSEIRHPFVVGSAHANDLFHAVKAAQSAFEVLSSNFVLMGHSQGGAAAWAAAQRQARRPVAGYLGAVTVAPPTNFTRVVESSPVIGLLIAFFTGHGLDQILPNFHLSEWLTEAGLRRLTLLRDVQGCNSAAGEVILDEGLVKPDFTATASFQRFAEIAENGRQEFAGPLLVLQGTDDGSIPVQSVSEAVNDTCSAFPTGQLEYGIFEGAGHGPELFASQRVWLDWIADRFAGKNVSRGCSQRSYSPARPTEAYQANLVYYLQLATQTYMAA